MSTGYIKDGRYVKTAGNAFSDYERHIQYGKEYWTGQYAPDGSNDKLYEMWLRASSNINAPQTTDIELGDLPSDLGSVHSFEGSIYVLYKGSDSEIQQETWWPLGGYATAELTGTTATGHPWHGTVFVRRADGNCKVYCRVTTIDDINSDGGTRAFRPRVRILYTRKAQSQESEE